jgi:Zn-dependent peptidase ImmA (M78 family)
MRERDARHAAMPREKAAYEYVRALDEGDLEAVVAIVQSALEDPELGMILAEIDAAYADEELLVPTADAERVRDLARHYLTSALTADETDRPEAPLTVGEVAARLKADRRLGPTDVAATGRLLTRSVPVPPRLSARAVSELAATLDIRATERFWHVFRDTAIMLGMGQSHCQARMAAAREARVRHPGKEHPGPTKLPTAGVGAASAEAGQVRIAAAVQRAFADAGIALDARAPGKAPLDDLIRAHPLRMAEVTGLTYAEARKFLDRETGQALPLSGHQDRPLAGYLFADEYAGFLYGCILVKQDDPVERRRFSAAHELGHYLLHFLPLLERRGPEATSAPRLQVEEAIYGDEEHPDNKLHGRITFSPTGESEVSPLPAEVDQMEREANRFAAELLMPAVACRELVARYHGTFGRRPVMLVRRMANDLLVSQEAMRWRLQSLQLLESPDVGDSPVTARG